MATTSSTSKQRLQLPAEDAILRFLEQDVMTERLDPDVLKKVAKIFANQPFIRNVSLKTLELPIKLLEINDLDYTLQRCAEGKCPTISRVAKGSMVAKKTETTLLTPVNVSPTISNDNFFGSLIAKHPWEEEVFKKQEAIALQAATVNKLGECLSAINDIGDYNLKNQVCLSVAKNFAQRGDFSSVELVVRQIKSHHGTLLALRAKNTAFSQLALVFAKHGFIIEGKQCIDAISSDYSKSDDSEYFIDLRECTYTHFVEELIKQKKIQEAGQLLCLVKKEDSYRLGKQIKMELGTWQEGTDDRKG